MVNQSDIGAAHATLTPRSRHAHASERAGQQSWASLYIYFYRPSHGICYVSFGQSFGQLTCQDN